MRENEYREEDSEDESCPMGALDALVGIETSEIDKIIYDVLPGLGFAECKRLIEEWDRQQLSELIARFAILRAEKDSGSLPSKEDYRNATATVFLGAFYGNLDQVKEKDSPMRDVVSDDAEDELNRDLKGLDHTDEFKENGNDNPRMSLVIGWARPPSQMDSNLFSILRNEIDEREKVPDLWQRWYNTVHDSLGVSASDPDSAKLIQKLWGDKETPRMNRGLTENEACFLVHMKNYWGNSGKKEKIEANLSEFNLGSYKLLELDDDSEGRSRRVLQYRNPQSGLYENKSFLEFHPDCPL